MIEKICRNKQNKQKKITKNIQSSVKNMETFRQYQLVVPLPIWKAVLPEERSKSDKDIKDWPCDKMLLITQTITLMTCAWALIILLLCSFSSSFFKSRVYRNLRDALSTNAACWTPREKGKKKKNLFVYVPYTNSWKVSHKVAKKTKTR